MQRLFIIGSCLFKLAKGVVGLPAHLVEGSRRGQREVMGGLQCPSHMLDSGTGRRQGQGFFTEALPVFERLYPHTCRGVMSSQIGQVCLTQHSRGTEGLECSSDGLV